METFANHHDCFICGTKIDFGEDVSLINYRKEICFKFETLVSRYLNLQSSVNMNTLNLNFDIAWNIVRNNCARDNKKEESVCCLSCVSEVENFCDAYKTWECLQLDMFHILGRVSNLMIPTRNNSQNEIISKAVEEKRRRHYPYLRLDNLKKSEGHKVINCSVATIQTQSEVVTDAVDGQVHQDDSDNFSDFSTRNDLIEDSDGIDDDKYCNDGKDSDSEQIKVMVKVQLETDDAAADDAKQHENDVVKTDFFHFFKTQLTRTVVRRTNDTECLFCDKRFLRSCDLVVHMRLHTREVPFICRKCQKEFTTRQYISQHINHTHNSSRVGCDICGIVVKDIRQHRSRAHGPNRWICKVCRKGFYSQAALKNHMPAHSEKRNFSCDICQRAFKFPNVLKRHIKEKHFSHRRVQNKIKGKAFNKKVN